MNKAKVDQLRHRYPSARVASFHDHEHSITYEAISVSN